LFAAIYKVPPDTAILWRDLAVGAFVTAILFTLGKSLVGIYLGRAAPSSAYGAAGELIVLMFWMYYSAQSCLAPSSPKRSLTSGEPRGAAAARNNTRVSEFVLKRNRRG
jgi:membrane protein